MSQHVPRRTVLTALAAAATVVPLGAAAMPAVKSVAMAAHDLQILTVGDESLAVSWTTSEVDPLGRRRAAPAGSELAIGPADSHRPLRVVHADSTPTTHHHVEITGLEPGRHYRFEARSDGVLAGAGTGAQRWFDGPRHEFRTLTPPPGRLVRTLALANDLHFGEQVSGEIVPWLPTGVTQQPGLAPYPTVMLEALLADIRRPDRAVDHLILAGDLTNDATPLETRALRRRLDAWGELGRDVLVCRGNHDRPRVGAAWQSGPVVPGSAHHDCWGAQFLPRRHMSNHDLAGLRILGLDTTRLDEAGGSMDDAQLDLVSRTLRAEPDRPTLVFGHHPVTGQSARTNPGGPGFVLDRHAATRLQSIYRRAPGVFLHHSGHTHRNRRTAPDLPIPVEFLEVAAIKEYPAGYALLRLYEGGYMVTFHTTRTADAHRWSARSRGQLFGLPARYSLGSLADRNHVVRRDLSGIEAMPRRQVAVSGTTRTGRAIARAEQDNSIAAQRGASLPMHVEPPTR